jgi:hypothetical protein
MTAPATSPEDEVQRWLARDPVGPGPWHAAALRFAVLRSRLLRHLVRDPSLWLEQGRNSLQGLARLGLLGLAPAPSVLAFWDPVRWPAVLGVGFLGLLLVDRLLGQRLSGFRNVFVDTAERIAWAVLAAETPDEGTMRRSSIAT